MKNISIWSEDIEKGEVNSLDADLDVDVAIVGGGITGLSVAYYLSDVGYNICLLESNRIGEGITSRTTGKITYLQEDLLLKIKDIYSVDMAKKYYESQKLAIKEINRIMSKNSISCDLKKSDSYIFAESKKDIKKIKELKELLEEFGERIESVYSLPDDTKVKYGIKGSGTYVFNAIKYLKGLKNAVEGKIKICEKTKVENIIKNDGGYILRANGYEVRARKVIVCTHYPFFLFPYLMPLKCSLEKSYVALYKTESDIEYNAITICKPTISLRYVEGENKRYKLILAKSHNICFDNDDEKHFSKIINIRKSPDYLWSNIDIITKDYMPYV
ncbi:MAG: FAD-binding oxidoreductase, partial [Bacilli bacterium]|nr:FAD-binding oxidoreductase [Bacilli bacterium]